VVEGPASASAALLRRFDGRLPAGCDAAARAAWQQLGIDVRSGRPNAGRLAAIAGRALEEARRGLYDVLLVDTAGRLHVESK